MRAFAGQRDELQWEGFAPLTYPEIACQLNGRFRRQVWFQGMQSTNGKFVDGPECALLGSTFMKLSRSLLPGQAASPLARGVENNVDGFGRSIPHRKMAACFKPVHFRVWKGGLCSVRLPRET